jgi:hypothetical protein
MTHPSNSAEVQKRLAEVLGREAYNRLVDSVPNTRQRGRLRFWQEELIQQASLSGIVISTPEEFIRVFEGASPVPVPSEPWTREVFLSRIEAWPHGGFPFDETPTEWMAAAWEVESVRSARSAEMARTVGKCGELAYTQEYLRYLSQALSISRQVELFLSIRDSGNQLREVEFRPGFERAFPDCVAHLPPQLTTAELADQLGISVQEYESSFRTPNYFPTHTENDEQEDIPF